jgi:hypothetical protein
MVSLGKLSRLAQIGTLPETRSVLLSPVTRARVRATASRIVHDRMQLARDLAHPTGVRSFAQGAVQHPATRELASVGLMFLPGRYLPIGWAAGWATRRIARRMARRRLPEL